MGRAAELWDRNLSVAETCRSSRFVTALARGELPRSTFAAYIAQDAVFLEAFARAYALCVARAADRREMDAFRALLDGVFDELRLHSTYAGRWGAPLDVAPAAATSAYTDFLLRVAALEPVGHAVAAMAPCMRLYAWLGEQLDGVTPADGPFREWIDTYASADFHELASTLEALLDGETGGRATSEPVMASHYAQAMRLELAFFEAAVDDVPDAASRSVDR